MTVGIDTYVTIAEALDILKIEDPDLFQLFYNAEQIEQEKLLTESAKKINNYVLGYDCIGMVFPLSFQNIVPKDIKIAQALEASAMYKKFLNSNNSQNSRNTMVISKSEKANDVLFYEKYASSVENPFIVSQIINMLNLYKNNSISTIV